MELRGFEPLTSAVPSAACLTSSSLPFVGGSSATSAHSWSPLGNAGSSVRHPASASNVSPVSTRIAWLPVAASKRRAITAT